MIIIPNTPQAHFFGRPNADGNVDVHFCVANTLADILTAPNPSLAEGNWQWLFTSPMAFEEVGHQISVSTPAPPVPAPTLPLPELIMPTLPPTSYIPSFVEPEPLPALSEAAALEAMAAMLRDKGYAVSSRINPLEPPL